MTKLPFFKFTIADWMLGRIQRLPLETKGAFIDLLCMYWHNECIYYLEDAETDIDAENVEYLLKRGIIHQEDGRIIIKFLDEQRADYEEVSKKRSEAGRRGGQAKAKQAQANAKQNLPDKIREDKEGEGITPREAYNILKDDLVSLKKLGAVLGFNASVCKEKLEQFAKEQDAIDKDYPDLKEFKAHFRNYIKKMNENKPHSGAMKN